MKKISGVKYLTSALDEFQPGSKNQVLKNLRGITTVREIDKAEFAGYITAERKVIAEFTKDQRLTMNDINQINSWFLGDIYPWAGTIRTVNISKDGFPFATAFTLPQVINEFEKEVLSVHTPCEGKNAEEVAEHIAVVHCELLLLHPYREGNGRTARLVATLMAYQANLPGIDFSFIKSGGKEFKKYIVAIQEGIKKNYDPMTQLVLRALRLALTRTGADSVA